MKLLQYTTTWGDPINTVVYWRPLEVDEAAQKRADELNAFDVNHELEAYNAACASGETGPVETKIEEVDA